MAEKDHAEELRRKQRIERRRMLFVWIVFVVVFVVAKPKPIERRAKQRTIGGRNQCNTTYQKYGHKDQTHTRIRSFFETNDKTGADKWFCLEGHSEDQVLKKKANVKTCALPRMHNIGTDNLRRKTEANDFHMRSWTFGLLMTLLLFSGAGATGGEQTPPNINVHMGTDLHIIDVESLDCSVLVTSFAYSHLFRCNDSGVVPKAKCNFVRGHISPNDCRVIYEDGKIYIENVTSPFTFCLKKYCPGYSSVFQSGGIVSVISVTEISTTISTSVTNEIQMTSEGQTSRSSATTIGLQNHEFNVWKAFFFALVGVFFVCIIAGFYYRREYIKKLLKMHVNQPIPTQEEIA